MCPPVRSCRLPRPPCGRALRTNDVSRRDKMEMQGRFSAKYPHKVVRAMDKPRGSSRCDVSLRGPAWQNISALFSHVEHRLTQWAASPSAIGKHPMLNQRTGYVGNGCMPVNIPSSRNAIQAPGKAWPKAPSFSALARSLRRRRGLPHRPPHLPIQFSRIPSPKESIAGPDISWFSTIPTTLPPPTPWRIWP